jgi:hypothetical protein
MEDDLDVIIFNAVAATIPKLSDIQTSVVDAKLTPVNAGPCNFSENEQLLVGPCLRKIKKYDHGGWFKCKIKIFLWR